MGLRGSEVVVVVVEVMVVVVVEVACGFVESGVVVLGATAPFVALAVSTL